MASELSRRPDDCSCGNFHELRIYFNTNYETAVCCSILRLGKVTGRFNTTEENLRLRAHTIAPVRRPCNLDTPTRILETIRQY